MNNTINTIILTTLVITVLALVLISDRNVSKETMIEIYETERASECYGDHEYHCNKYYDDIIKKINAYEK